MNKGKLIFAQAMEHVPLSICGIAKKMLYQDIATSLLGPNVKAHPPWAAKR